MRTEFATLTSADWRNSLQRFRAGSEPNVVRIQIREAIKQLCQEKAPDLAKGHGAQNKQGETQP